MRHFRKESRLYITENVWSLIWRLIVVLAVDRGPFIGAYLLLFFLIPGFDLRPIDKSIPIILYNRHEQVLKVLEDREIPTLNIKERKW